MREATVEEHLDNIINDVQALAEQGSETLEYFATDLREWKERWQESNKLLIDIISAIRISVEIEPNPLAEEILLDLKQVQQMKENL